MTNSTNAAAVSAKLRKLGHPPISADEYRRDGIRVRRAATPGGAVLVTVSNTGGHIEQEAATVAKDLRGAGFDVQAHPHHSGKHVVLWVSKAAPVRTACGRIASPVEGEPLMWLVRCSLHTWWVIELYSYDTDITTIDLTDFSFGSPWGVSATARKISRRDGSDHPGWYIEVSGNTVGPMRTQREALDSMLTQIADNRAARRAYARSAVENGV